VTIEGKQHELVLHPPRVEQVGGLFCLPAFRSSLAKGLRRGELNQIADLDGVPIWNAISDSVLEQPSALAPVWQARNELYSYLVEQGRVDAICASCGRATDIDLAFYVVAMRLPPWRLFDTNGFLHDLTLSEPEPPMPPSYLQQPAELPIAVRGLAPRPADFPRAERLVLRLPSARTGLTEPDDAASVVMGDIKPEAEAEAWRKFAPPHGEQPAGRTWWSFDSASFRAVLRLSVALERVETADHGPLVSSPEAVEQFFLADLQFADVVYHATHDLPVPVDANRAAIQCSCGKPFLPVR
jgi:hypothetical protein